MHDSVEHVLRHIRAERPLQRLTGKVDATLVYPLTGLHQLAELFQQRIDLFLRHGLEMGNRLGDFFDFITGHALEQLPRRLLPQRDA